MAGNLTEDETVVSNWLLNRTISLEDVYKILTPLQATDLIQRCVNRFSYTRIGQARGVSASCSMGMCRKGARKVIKAKIVSSMTRI